MPWSFMYATHWLFLSTSLQYRFIFTLLPPRLSVTPKCLLFTVKTLSLIQSPLNSLLSFLAHTEMLLVLGSWRCHRPVQTWLAYPSAEEKGLKILASGLCCTKKGQGPEPTRLGFIRKVSHLVSKNSGGKEETQLQARWEEAVVLLVC